MSEPKLISPMLDEFVMGDPISNHHGIRCCPAMNKNTENKYFVKVISIPASRTKLDALLLTGAYKSEQDAQEYFRQLSDGICREVRLIDSLSKQEGFCGFEGHQVVPMEDMPGFDVYLLSPYRRTLARQFAKKPLTHLDAVNLGLDICAALVAARRSGYIYCNLKPENIYILPSGEYKIGDIGFVSLRSLKYASLSEHCLHSYNPPEITDAFSALNDTLDTYALGMVLYQIYNGGVLPQITEDMAELPAPEYADEEMTKIILKACSIKPEDRWADPAQMGQALVTYMQQIGANNEPIVPPAPEVSEPKEVAAEEAKTESNEQAAEQQNIQEEVIEEDVIPEDLIAPEELHVINESETPEDVEKILEQADVLASLEVPEPVVAPEAIDVPIPEPIIEEEPVIEEVPIVEETPEIDEIVPAQEVIEEVTEEPVETVEQAAEETAEDASAEAQEISEEITEEAAEEVAEELPETANAETADDIIDLIADVINDDHAEEPTEDHAPEVPAEEIPDETAEAENNTAEEEDQQSPAPAAVPSVEESYEEPVKKSHWLRNTILIIMFLSVILAGTLFYFFHYLQKIDSLTVTGSKDGMQVTIVSDVDDTMLTVVCTDIYGKSVVAPVINGHAEFSGLAADTEYTVTVEISGFHQLTGQTTANYFTPSKTSILSINTITGTIPGSIEVSFSVDGPDSDRWLITYKTGNEPSKTAVINGHSFTLTGLEIGSKYTAHIAPEKELYISGQQEFTFEAMDVIIAQDLKIVSCADSKLTVEWTVPEGSVVDSWTVTCSNGSDYNKTITVTEPTATFEDLDCTDAFTVDVKAENQSVGQQVSVGANSVTISNIVANTSEAGVLKLTWDSSIVPEAGWIIAYTIKGMEEVQYIYTAENSITILPAIPKTEYAFQITTQNNSDMFGNHFTCTTPNNGSFYRQYGEYVTKASNIRFDMCLTPEVEDWERSDLAPEDYRNTFKIGEKGSFLGRITAKYGISYEDIVIAYVIAKNDGSIYSINSQTRAWSTIWYKSFGELDIPALPEEVGKYTISIYFNGQFVKKIAFEMTE